METKKYKVTLVFECEVPEDTNEFDLKEFIETQFDCNQIHYTNRLVDFNGLPDLCVEKIDAIIE